MQDFKVNLLKLMLTLSRSLDFDRYNISDHHSKVAFTAVRLAERMGLNRQEQLDILLSALVHDIGAGNWDDKDVMKQFIVEDADIHCRQGYNLLSDSYFRSISPVILSHHDHYNGGNRTNLEGMDIPLYSRVIFAADRTCISIDDNKKVLTQHSQILDRIKTEKGRLFDPAVVDALGNEGEHEEFWLLIQNNYARSQIFENWNGYSQQVSVEELEQIVKLFASIIDNKSVFTHIHSKSVAAVASALGGKLGLSSGECMLLKVAGLVHDLGKLSVPNEILDKPARLSSDEIATVRGHTFFTYYLLHPAFDDERICTWAAFHHEKLDGSGYPFKKKAHELDTGARIMALADIFVALTENRPYRKGLDKNDTLAIIMRDAKARRLDADIALVMEQNYEDLHQFVQ